MQTHSGGLRNPRSQSDTVLSGILKCSAIAFCVSFALLRAHFTSSYVIKCLQDYFLLSLQTITKTAMEAIKDATLLIKFKTDKLNACIFCVIEL